MRITTTSGAVKSLKGLGSAFTGGRSEEISRPRRPMTGMKALFNGGAGMLPFPTILRSVSGKNLKTQSKPKYPNVRTEYI